MLSEDLLKVHWEGPCNRYIREEGLQVEKRSLKILFVSWERSTQKEREQFTDQAGYFSYFVLFLNSLVLVNSNHARLCSRTLQVHRGGKRLKQDSELKRCSMARNCLQCIKYLMFVFNLLFWLGGCGILGVGIWLAVTQGNFATLSASFPSLSAANVLIAAGTVVMVIGFLGCIGAIKENKCLLLSFFILLLIVLLLETISMSLFFAYKEEIDRYAQADLKEGLWLYDTEGNIGLTNAWSIIQTDFRCCGVSNYTDWFEVYNTTQVPDSCCLEYSQRCGLHSPGTWWKAPCYERVKIWLQENLLAVWIFGLCIALIQVLGLAFAMTMYCQVLKTDTFYA
ncbi:tetraspanin-4a isoform X1 [Huso huso]|uniref:Tetraspanin-4a isoform X1 n=2 Tax=Acipenseridae TaxID=7900 RepID=A0ABR0YKI7_HUSHU